MPDGGYYVKIENSRPLCTAADHSDINRVESIEKASSAYTRKISSYVYRIVHSAEDTEDIVQETFARLCAVPEIGQIRNLEAFLFTTAYRLAVDLLRRNKRAPIDGRAAVAVEEVRDLAPQAETHLAGRQELALLYERVEALPPQRRRTFILRKFRDLSYQQIAEEMGITVGSVRKHLSAALHDCRSHLEQYR